MGSDPASVAFDTLQSAVKQDADVVIIDTAGRLHNKVNLMNELTKVKRVMQKVIPEAPTKFCWCWMVLLGKMHSSRPSSSQPLPRWLPGGDQTGRTAKGGVVIGISDQFQIPVKYIGVGEGMEDLQVFNKLEFVDSFLNNQNYTF